MICLYSTVFHVITDICYMGYEMSESNRSIVIQYWYLLNETWYVCTELFIIGIIPDGTIYRYIPIFSAKIRFMIHAFKYRYETIHEQPIQKLKMKKLVFGKWRLVWNEEMILILTTRFKTCKSEIRRKTFSLSLSIFGRFDKKGSAKTCDIQKVSFPQQLTLYK